MIVLPLAAAEDTHCNVLYENSEIEGTTGHSSSLLKTEL